MRIVGKPTGAVNSKGEAEIVKMVIIKQRKEISDEIN